MIVSRNVLLRVMKRMKGDEVRVAARNA